MAFCGNCGAQLNDGDKFCPKCGNAIDELSSDSQQEFDEEQKATINQWKKIAKYAILLGAIATALWFVVPKIVNYNEPEQTAKKILINEFIKEKGVLLNINDIKLLHKVGNEYTGIVEGSIDGEATQFDVNVIYDGSDVLVKWQWPDVCR